MDEYSTVYGRFYRGTEPINGSAVFRPKQRFVTVDGTLRALDTLTFSVDRGVLVDISGNPGVSIPASYFGLLWDIYVRPLGYSNMLQSFPGDIISIGD